MRKGLFRLGLLLLLAALSNVAVAWYCAVASPLRERDDYIGSPADFLWLQQLGWAPSPSALPTDQAVAFARQYFPSASHCLLTGRAVQWHLFFDPSFRNYRGTPRYCAARIAAGWPFQCMHGGYLVANKHLDSLYWPSAPAFLWWPRFDMQGGELVLHVSDLVGWRTRPVPLAIAPLPFALNTALYFTALLFISSVPLLIRRFVRRRAHLCPTCAYPSGVSPFCTECGTPLRPSARVA